jgi:hypothetical protein
LDGPLAPIEGLVSAARLGIVARGVRAESRAVRCRALTGPDLTQAPVSPMLECVNRTAVFELGKATWQR